MPQLTFGNSSLNRYAPNASAMNMNPYGAPEPYGHPMHGLSPYQNQGQGYGNRGLSPYHQQGYGTGMAGDQMAKLQQAQQEVASLSSLHQRHTEMQLRVKEKNMQKVTGTVAARMSGKKWLAKTRSNKALREAGELVDDPAARKERINRLAQPRVPLTNRLGALAQAKQTGGAAPTDAPALILEKGVTTDESH